MSISIQLLPVANRQGCLQTIGLKSSVNRGQPMFSGQKTGLSWQKGLLPLALATMMGGGCDWGKSPEKNKVVNPPHAVQSSNAQDEQPKMLTTLTENDLRQPLQTTGIQGLIHGAVPDKQEFVLSYRNPENFFQEFFFPLIPDPRLSEAEKAKVLDTLASVRRHDRVNVKGRFVNNPKHIFVRDIEVLSRFESELDEAGKIPSAPIPDDLAQKNELVGIVHAVLKEGKMLAVEYRGSIYPLVVKDNSVSKDLWRGDKVKIRYKIQQKPGQPQHMVLLPGDKSVEVIEPITSFHGKTLNFEGPLVLFQKSPVLQRNIWAVAIQGDDGTERYFTLANFEDSDDWKKLDEQFETWWKEHPESRLNARNKIVNPKIIVKGTGIVPSLQTEEEAKTEEEREQIREMRRLSVNQAFLSIQLSSSQIENVVSSEPPEVPQTQKAVKGSNQVPQRPCRK